MFRKNINPNQKNIFVSIGAGINQVPLIQEAKKLGLQIVGVDQSILAAGIRECDIRIHESIENYRAIYQKLRELLLDGEIIGILSKSYGSAVKTSSYIANKLNIPQITYQRIDDFIDKKRMKSVLNSNDLKTPSYDIFHRLNNHKLKQFEYPFIIKPIKGHAKVGVCLIQNQDDLDNYFGNITHNNGKYIIEDYIKGDEVIAAGIVNKGVFHLIDITDKVVKPPNFVDLMHISPSKYYSLWDNIKNIGQKIADSFEITTSPLIIELMVTPEKDIHIIETAPEFGGEFISDILIPQRTGYNIIRESINAVLDRDFKPPEKIRNKSAAIVKYLTGHDGILASYCKQRQFRRNGVVFSRMFKDIGAVVTSPVTNHDRLGVVIVKGKTREEAIDMAENAEKEMKIVIEPLNVN